MDFAWSNEQREFYEQVKRFAQESLNEGLVEREGSGEFSEEGWQRCVDFGLISMVIPERYQGLGDLAPERDWMTVALGLEGLGYGCRDNGLTFALNAQIWSLICPILRFGSEQQKLSVLPKIARGEWKAAQGMTEPEAGSDVYRMEMRAERRGEEGYVLNGKKTLITLAPIADIALIFATVDAGRGNWGITAFLVETKSEGFFASSVIPKMGLRTVPMGEFVLKDCFVPMECRLGDEGGGLLVAQYALELERCCVLASQVGAMHRQLDETIRFARKRKQFKQPIGRFQSVSNRIVEMKMRLDVSRLLLYRAAWLKQQGRQAVTEGALAKLYISEAFLESGMDAIRVNGGRGYLTESEVERDLRDAVGGVLYGGTSDIQRNIVAGMLGLS